MRVLAVTKNGGNYESNKHQILMTDNIKLSIPSRIMPYTQETTLHQSNLIVDIHVSNCNHISFETNGIHYKKMSIQHKFNKNIGFLSFQPSVRKI